MVAALPEPTLLHLDEMPMAIEKAPASTAVTIVGSTPTYGMGAYKAQRDQEEMAAESALGLYSAAEPPKKRQRSAAAYLFGAAFETVIFTSAVALSAYQLLTGKGRLQGIQDASVDANGETASSAEGTDAFSAANHSLMPIESAPVNIPTRTPRHPSSSPHAHLLGKSLHHHHHQGRHLHHSSNHKSRHPKSGSKKHGLSASLPHSNPFEPDHPFYERAMIPPKRPNTGTEDNDEQFLRMEAQLSTLIAEGKRALSSRIQDHQ
ncbi:hypothetical protein EC957_006187 [Mortierella hygrophila]|uniref:Uncharacterized protein n=1 Tax=Mortierella hygrophila TaxID=979708 RepID=A0A9P6EZF6_9FUNG|nr:hypothetical protein EC957_006187 [Mortierella hygrophila]